MANFSGQPTEKYEEIQMSRMKLLAIAAASLLVSSCHMLPGAVEKGEDPNAKGPAVEFGPAPPKVATAPPQVAPVQPPEVKVYPGTGVFVNPKPVPPQPPSAPEEASLNFEGLDVREVAKVILGDYLKESYTVHPAVTGTVTFRTIKPISRKELLPTLEMLLRQNAAAVVIEEGIYKILPIAMVRGSVTPQLGGAAAPIPPGFSVVVVPLKFVGAREMMRLLEPVAADNTIRVDEIRNLVIIAGHQREMRHLVDTIELFDVDWLSGFSVGLFPIKSADVKTLVADLDKIFGPQAAGPLGGIVRVIPIERLNALLLVTTQPKYLDLARTWVERLDQLGGTSGGSRFFVYYVRNGKAENLAQLIGELFSGRRSPAAPSLAPGSRPAEIRSPGATTPTATGTTAPPAATFQIQAGVGTTASEVRVIADKDTNSLLILATPSDYDVIESALRKLDVIPRQVLVEVFLAEIALVDDLQFGIEWFISGRNNSNTTGTINLGGLPATPTSPVPAGSVFQLVSLSGDAVRAVLNAKGEDSRTRVLASPQIMVLDNQKAQVKIGSKISVQTQSQSGVNTGTGVLNSFQYLETGILLAVTPRINSNNQVTLEVSQEVSSAVPDTGGTAINPNPDVSQRSVQTTVVIASGESIVLAGLIREDTSRSSIGVPLLSKIPVLGAAFGRQGMNRTRTELVLIITPKIVNDSRQAREVSEELRKKLPLLEGAIHSFGADAKSGASETKK
jgi:general secretion pathway protein D